MRTNGTPHLTEEEFAEYLLGLSTDTARVHLLACDECREEMEIFGASLAAFSQTSLAWSREQAATHPVHVEPRKTGPRPAPRFAWQTSWAAAAAAVLVFSIALSVALHHTAHNNASVSAPAADLSPTAQPQEDAAVIAEDNQMMTAINAEISQPELSPVESFATYRPEHVSVQDGRHLVKKKS